VVAEMRPLIAAADRFLIAAGIMLVITYATGNRLTWRHARTYLFLSRLDELRAPMPGKKIE